MHHSTTTKGIKLIATETGVSSVVFVVPASVSKRMSSCRKKSETAASFMREYVADKIAVKSESPSFTTIKNN
ncbi:hypothetical protein ANN_19761 [Periplaneta americana]|uniref:Uncharacterized protein n=1 Tax=Periplaneta americana TaxID=6978 RepID=A0ABQ8SBX0_PERAM|nr:hypothetical protein ANN_19761 [Periplaneta americana]